MKRLLLAGLLPLLGLALPALAADSGMVRMSGGSFTMGSPQTESGRSPDEQEHRVSLPGFLMASRAVTQAEYRAMTGENPSHFQGADLPVENVTWFEAVRFCNALSAREGLEPVYRVGTGDEPEVIWNRDANGYRLPTEAEWEYAARAGTRTPFSTGANISVDQANYYGSYPYNDAPSGRYRQETVPVGSLPPNPWGLFEVHGNVWEWCWDRYGPYEAGDQTRPAGPDAGMYRVNRGGGWNDFGRHLRSAYRAAHNPSNRTFNLGFRLARNAD